MDPTPKPMRASDYHCTCCGTRGVRFIRGARWKLHVLGSLFEPGEIVPFMLCPKCDLVAPQYA